MIDDAGAVALRLGMADGTVETVSVKKPLLGAPLVPSPPPATTRNRAV